MVSTPTNIDHTVIGAVVEGATSDLNVQTSALIGFLAIMAVLHSPGPDAGAVVPLPMAHPVAEMRANFCGDTLIISVQHPGEQCPFNPRSPLIEILRC